MTDGELELCVVVLAHNEARRIATCLRSLLREPGDFPIHVVVNGTTDDTAAIARRLDTRVIVHDYREGGKARSWNRFVLRDLAMVPATCVFVDGDAEVTSGSIAALATALATDPHANAAAALPDNGRRMAAYIAEMTRTHGLFGDLYALRGTMIARMRDTGIALPDDLIGDDGLIGALAKTDLGHEDAWRDDRVVTCLGAGFLAEPVTLHRPASWVLQYRRMVSYSVRHFQNRIISAIMRRQGPAGLPDTLASLYGEWLPQFRPRGGVTGWFDRRALARMHAQLHTKL